MKIDISAALIIRSSSRTSIGGDTIQCQKTSNELKNLGVKADIYFSDEIIDYSQYSILHFFNLIRPSDIIKHIDKSKLPFVISTIFVEYRPEDNFSNKILIRVARDFPFLLEYIKTLIRWITGKDKIVSTKYFFMGQRASIFYLLKRASYLLPNSESEYKRIQKKFGLQVGKYKKIVNGVDKSVFSSAKSNPEYRDTVICVGRIEPLKNQLQLIKALNLLGYRSFIIGNPSNNLAYYEECKKTAHDNVKFISHIAQEELAGIMKSAKVHVLASRFETTGLASLEAGFCGCNLVVTTGGDQSEYFEHIAEICDPEDQFSIISAVKKAYESPRNYKKAQEYISNNYHWGLAAEQTLSVYKEVLAND